MATGGFPPERDHPHAPAAPEPTRSDGRDHRRSPHRVVLQVDGTGVYVEPVTLRRRLTAALLCDRLDRMLAAGLPAESDVLLAVRAEHLASARTRTDLARTVGRLLRAASGPEHGISRASSMAVLSRVREARPELEDLIDHLLAPVPVSARGMALVRLLLRDGSGPLFRYESPADLRHQVRCASAALEPAEDWPA
jgi:hypothetical protein